MNISKYPVELKFTIDNDVERALRKLDPKDDSKRQIWFLEDDTPGLRKPRPLGRASVVARLRTGKKRDDSTIKLRPARESQLVEPWSTSFEDGGQEYRIEQDWAGSRRSLAASCVAEFPPGTLEPLIAASRLTPAFDGKQLRFLHDCAGIPVTLAALRPLGPIKSVQWKDHDLDGISVNLERWTVGPLDFLEVSARAAAGADTDPEKLQRRIQDALNRLRLKIADEQVTKTQAVLDYLLGGSTAP